MSESKNTNVEKDGKVNKDKQPRTIAGSPGELKATKEAIRPTGKAVNLEPSKSERLDRMEKTLELIEDGILILINSTRWMNGSITPIGTHNPGLLIKPYANLEEAVEGLYPEDAEILINY